MTIGDDSARLGRLFFQRTLPFFAFRAFTEPGTSVVMKMRPCAHAGDEAARLETFRCQRFLPFLARTAYAMPSLRTKYRTPFTRIGWNSTRPLPFLNLQRILNGGWMFASRKSVRSRW